MRFRQTMIQLSQSPALSGFLGTITMRPAVPIRRVGPGAIMSLVGFSGDCAGHKKVRSPTRRNLARPQGSRRMDGAPACTRGHPIPSHIPKRAPANGASLHPPRTDQAETGRAITRSGFSCCTIAWFRRQDHSVNKRLPAPAYPARASWRQPWSPQRPCLHSASQGH